MKWLRTVLIISFVLVWVLTLPGLAVALNYGNVVGHNHEYHQWDPNNGNYQWNGAFGYSYVQSTQYVWYEHLNSTYMSDEVYSPPGKNWYEGGWTWWATNGTKESAGPRYFAAWSEGWVYRDTLPSRSGPNGEPDPAPWEHLNINLGRAASGQSHKFHVFLDTRVNPWQIRWYFDDNIASQLVPHNAVISQGYILAGSERETSLDNNWGHWFNLMRQNGTNNWANWADVQLKFDNDPPPYGSGPPDLHRYPPNEEYIY